MTDSSATRQVQHDGTKGSGVAGAARWRMTRMALLVYCAISLALAGCATVRNVPHGPVAKLPAGAPKLSEIAADLRANDTALADFRAAASFTLTSPKIESIQSFRTGTVAYRKPSDLYVIGKKNLGAVVFELTSRGNEFLIEFPAVQDVDDRYYCSFEADDLANVPFPVAPADIAHEMFQPIDWSKTKLRDIRLIAFDETSGKATLSISLDDGLRREIVVQGTPWHIVHNTLTDSSGATLSDTSMSEYVEVDGIRVPTLLDAEFPVERTHVRFELRNVRVNTGLPGISFTWDWPPGQ